ncbi:MAG: hypothetical protein LC624_03090, partial [Halobacteriales archaeon]|nr:hypothetical protein [Halobacteriales archaeon]
VHAWRQRERDAKKERGQELRASHARGLDEAVSWELERMAEEPERVPGPADPTKPRLGLRIVKDDGRKYAILTLCVANRAGDDLVVEARKRIDD